MSEACHGWGYINPLYCPYKAECCILGGSSAHDSVMVGGSEFGVVRFRV